MGDSAVNTLIGIFSLLLTTLVLQNAVFSRALDITFLLILPAGRKSLWRFGLMLTGVTTIASVLATLVNPAIGQWEHARYLRPVVYVLLLAVLYGFACLLLNWKKRDWFHDHSAMLAMAFFMFEAGIVTVSCLAIRALRILVSISAMGSFTSI